jgi:hypothetical protein
MSDILPEPTDSETPLEDVDGGNKIPKVKHTMFVLTSLIVLAVLSLVGFYIYNNINNNNQNNIRKQDLRYISNTLNGYYSLYHNYPTLKQINSSTFEVFNPNLNRSKFSDPASDVKKLFSSPTVNGYAYEVGPKGCNNQALICSSYKLIAILSNGKDYIVTNP